MRGKGRRCQPSMKRKAGKKKRRRRMRADEAEGEKMGRETPPPRTSPHEEEQKERREEVNAGEERGAAWQSSPVECSAGDVNGVGVTVGAQGREGREEGRAGEGSGSFRIGERPRGPDWSPPLSPLPPPSPASSVRGMAEFLRLSPPLLPSSPSLPSSPPPLPLPRPLPHLPLLSVLLWCFHWIVGL